MRKTSIPSVAPRLILAGALVIAVACMDRATSALDAKLKSESGRPEPASAGLAGRMDAPPAVADAVAPSVGMREAKAQEASATTAQLPNVSASTNMIIRNGNASVLVDSLELAIARITDMAARLGGFVANTQIQSGDRQVPSATIELKLPSTRFEQAANELAPLGKVEYVNTTAEDVGEEFVDVTARMTNARHLEDRLVELLARRTGKLEEVLSVERELARVREEIERYEGRLRFLRARVAMSTLSITVHEKAPIVSSNPDENVIGTALTQSWRNFVFFIAAMISSMGWLVPLGGIVVAVVVLGRRLLRGRQVAPSPMTPKEA